MEKQQKRRSNKTQFIFNEEKLKYSFKDKSGGHSFDIHYGAIPNDSFEFEERNVWYRNLGAIWSLLGLFIIVSRYMETGVLRGSLWFTLGIICFIVYWFSEVSYKVINTEKGRIFVIKDKIHDEILDEIFTRKKEQLLSRYGEINYLNDPNSEANKFMWLLQEDAITRNEFEEIMKKLQTHHIMEQHSYEEEGKKIN